jgi:hypothetical protein
MLGGSIATTVRIRKKLGKQSMTSTNLITRLSTFIVLKNRKSSFFARPLPFSDNTAYNNEQADKTILMIKVFRAMLFCPEAQNMRDTRKTMIPRTVKNRILTLP